MIEIKRGRKSFVVAVDGRQATHFVLVQVY